MTQPTEDLNPVASATGIAAIPPAPRVVTPLVSRRAWTEPSVRVWWLVAISVLVVFIVYAVDRLWEREIDRRLIRDGAVVEARMMGNSTKYIQGQVFSPGDIINVHFDLNGQEYTDVGPIHTTMAVGQTLTIRVDRGDPQTWTDLTETAPLLASMFVGFMFLPVAPIVYAVAVVKQRKMKEQWRTGEAAAALVHDRKQTPVAPLSYAVRCSLRDQRDKRLFTVYVPRIGMGLEPGSVIWVITSYRQSRPVAALWFE